ncbi:AbiTii domain-containing protein [Streptomyces sp. NPDC001002]
MTEPARQRPQPVEQLEHGVLDDTAPLAGLLRLALVIGGHGASRPLRQWALNELEGYGGKPASSVPDYRRPRALIQADSHSPAWQRHGETISVLHLPDFTRGKINEDVTITYGVGQLQNLIDRTPPGQSVHLSLPGAAELRTLMSAMDRSRSRGIVIDDLYWAVSPSVLHDILDQVRTRLTQFVAELRSTMPAGSGTPTPEQVHRAVQNISITTGDNSPVTLTAPLAHADHGATASTSTGGQQRWWQRWRR